MKTMYYGGFILTNENIMYAEAVVTEDDKILYAGTKEEAESFADSSTRRIDLEGKTLMPAFIDAHGHFSGYAMSFLQVNLDGCNTFDSIKEKVRNYIAENKVEKGKFVICSNYDHNCFKDKKHPPLDFLDSICPGYPLMIQHKSGHMGLFNSLGLERIGITEDTPCPAGGKIGRTDGKLNGYLEENAYINYMKNAKAANFNDLKDAFKMAEKGYLSKGITTVQEGFMPPDIIGLYKELLEKEKFDIDIVGYPDVNARKVYKENFGNYYNQYKNHFKIGGYKNFADGSPQVKTAFMRTPYKDSGDYCGYGTLTDEQLDSFVEGAYEDGMQLLIHCNGDAACQQFMDAIERAENKGLDIKKIRPVMIHSQLLGVDQLAKVKELGIIPSFFVAHVYHWGDVHIENFGLERASKISPCASAEKEGIMFTFHQDAPVIEPNMLETIWAAVNRVTKNGVILGAEERISPLTAIKAVTKNAAYQYFEENEKGSIKAGKNADFVILDRNPLTVPAMEIRDIKVLATIKNGKACYVANK